MLLFPLTFLLFKINRRSNILSLLVKFLYKILKLRIYFVTHSDVFFREAFEIFITTMHIIDYHNLLGILRDKTLHDKLMHIPYVTLPVDYLLVKSSDTSTFYQLKFNKFLSHLVEKLLGTSVTIHSPMSPPFL